MHGFHKTHLFPFVFPFSGKWDGTDELAWLLVMGGGGVLSWSESLFAELGLGGLGI